MLLKEGLFITFEGIDGSGKTSIINKVSNNLNKIYNLKNIITKEPGDSQIGKIIRHLVQNTKDISHKAEFLLFAADRAEHIEKVIIPALKDNNIVLCDRFIDSSVAYQGYGYNLDINKIKDINNWLIKDIKIDLTFYIKIDRSSAKKRIFKRNEKLTEFEQKDSIFWNKVITGYEELSNDEKRIIPISGDGNITKIANKILFQILDYIKNKNQINL